MKSILGQSAHAWMPATGEAVEANLLPLRPKATPLTSTPATCWATIWCFAQVCIIQLVSVGTVVASEIPKVPPPLHPPRPHHQVWQCLTEAPCAQDPRCRRVGGIASQLQNSLRSRSQPQEMCSDPPGSVAKHMDTSADPGVQTVRKHHQKYRAKHHG